MPTAAVGYSLHQQRLYQASARVLLSQQNLAYALNGTPNNALQDPTRDAQTQAEVARVPVVATRALRLARINRTPSDFLAHSSVTSSPNSNILTFSVTDPSRFLAARLATAYANAFIAYRTRLDTASLDKAQRDVQRQIDRLTALGQKSSPLYNQFVGKAQSIATLAALQTSNASLIESAAPGIQVQPRMTRNVALALLLGLILGISLAFLWEALDTRVRSAEEIGERLGLPLLARLPAPPQHVRDDGKLVMRDDALGISAEVFRILRTNLEFVLLGLGAKTIMVTSAVEREGKSTTIANLALTLAHGGRDVVLVDLDLRRPVLDRYFSLQGRPGLTQVAIGHVTLEDALAGVPLGAAADGKSASANGRGQLTSLSSLTAGALHVLPTGPLPPNAGEFVNSAALEEILAELRTRFDVVLIDTPPALQLGDALTLSRKLDGMLIVARATFVRRPALTELRRALEASPATSLGFVLTGADDEDSPYGYYARGYHGTHVESKMPTA